MTTSQPPMHDRNGTPPPAAARYGIVIAGVLAMLIGAFWLGAWFTGYAARHSLAGLITVKTNMALCQLLGGMALLLLGMGRPTGARRRVGTLFATIVFLIGALTLGENLFGWNLGIDQLLAKEPAGSAATLSPNRIGYPGSLSLVLVGIGLLALALRRRAIVPYLGITVCVINLVPAVGYLYGIGAFYHIALTGIAWPTVIALMSLGIGLVFARTDGGPMAALALPDVALRPGYSTAGTLGMGYKMMIEFADKVRLATGDEGTAVALEIKIHPTELSPSERLIGSSITGGRL